MDEKTIGYAMAYACWMRLAKPWPGNLTWFIYWEYMQRRYKARGAPSASTDDKKS